MENFNNANEAKKYTDSLITGLKPEECYNTFINICKGDITLIPVTALIHGWYYGIECEEFCSQVYRRAFLLLALKHIS